MKKMLVVSSAFALGFFTLSLSGCANHDDSGSEAAAVNPRVQSGQSAYSEITISVEMKLSARSQVPDISSFLRCPGSHPHKVGAFASGAPSNAGADAMVEEGFVCATSSTRPNSGDQSRPEQQTSQAAQPTPTPEPQQNVASPAPGCFVFTGSSPLFDHPSGEKNTSHLAVGNNQARILVDILVVGSGRVEANVLSGSATGKRGWLNSADFGARYSRVDGVYCTRAYDAQGI